MFLTFRNGRWTYHVAECINCGASVTMTRQLFRALHPRMSTLTFLVDNIECCKSPRYLWVWNDTECTT